MVLSAVFHTQTNACTHDPTKLTYLFLRGIARLTTPPPPSHPSFFQGTYTLSRKIVRSRAVSSYR